MKELIVILIALGLGFGQGYKFRKKKYLKIISSLQNEIEALNHKLEKKERIEMLGQYATRPYTKGKKEKFEAALVEFVTSDDNSKKIFLETCGIINSIKTISDLETIDLYLLRNEINNIDDQFILENGVIVKDGGKKYFVDIEDYKNSFETLLADEIPVNTYRLSYCELVEIFEEIRQNFCE